MASNSALLLYRQGQVDDAVQSLAPVAEECTQIYRQMTRGLESQFNPFGVHLAIQMDKTEDKDDFAMRFHADISVADC